MSTAQTEASASSNYAAAVVIGDGPPMSANVRVASPGVLSMSFRLNTGAEEVPRLVGDLATVTVDRNGASVLVEVVSVSVMGYVEVCECTILRHLSGPPIERRTERRKTTRHRFAESVNVNVAPVGTAKNAVAHLGDISAGGCGLELNKDAYQKVGSLVEATLTFELPGLDKQIVLSAKRRNTRAAGGDGVWMGMVWSREMEEASRIRELSDYLKQRWGGASTSS